MNSGKKFFQEQFVRSLKKLPDNILLNLKVELLKFLRWNQKLWTIPGWKIKSFPSHVNCSLMLHNLDDDGESSTILWQLSYILIVINFTGISNMHHQFSFFLSEAFLFQMSLHGDRDLNWKIDNFHQRLVFLLASLNLSRNRHENF